MFAATTPDEKSTQHRLSDFLYTELLHTLGAYQVAGEKLEKMYDDSSGRLEDKPLRDIIEQARDHNKLLRERLHHPDPELDARPDPELEPNERRRHPSPLKCRCEKSPCGCRRPDSNLLAPVHAFYATADQALRFHLEALIDKRPMETSGEKLGKLLARIHDPQRRREEDPDPKLVKGRQERTQYRRKELEGLVEFEPDQLAMPPKYRPTDTEFEAILSDHLDGQRKDGQPPLHLTILEAMSDAHKWMHQAEHLRSQTFGAMFTKIPETHAKMQAMLDRSIVLNTFVYCAARSVPWVFAENDQERAQVVGNFDECYKRLTPTYCMWIGNELGLLALERRAYTWWTLGRHDLAYSDFHKLIRLLRVLRQQVSRRATRMPGTKTLIEGLTATAEHHIGRIYRGQHAHRVALRYFDRASNHMTPWEADPEIGSILKNSRWRVNGLISQGKANYELGRMKTSLLYYARAWRAFLQLAESESHATANFDVVEQLICWLESIADEPVLSKAELSQRIVPLVGQFETMYSPVHLRLLAAEIMMRFGHLLYLLKLPPLDWTLPADLEDLPPKPDHELARRCMFQAAALDKTSTLIATDLLKIRHGAESRESGKAAGNTDGGGGGPEMALLEEQWPAGGSRFEEAVRVIEYVVQTWLDRSRPGGEESDPPGSREIARELLRSFLAHTDSSNVKLAQVYRYLMQRPHEAAGDVGDSGPTIEVVCLRRYSSFFPFLPRPAAFHALGGGYLVQVREENDEESFGIAVDPGPNFLENLYCCGYALSNIHLIVLTHDHADHIASLDALLALMGSRQMLHGGETFSRDKRLTIVGNKSVVERYRFFNKKHPVKMRPKKGGQAGETERADRGDVVRVMSFEQFHRIAGRRDPEQRRQTIERERILLTPDSLRMEPIQTVDHADARGYVSQGFLLTVGHGASRSSVLFTSDTGPPLAKNGAAKNRDDGGPHLAGGRKSLAKAIASADVVVAHLSSIPLPELRRLAELAPGDGRRDELAETFKGLWGKAAAKAKSDGETAGIDETRFLLRQLQFAFRSLGRKGRDIDTSPLSRLEAIADPSETHLYLAGLLSIAEQMAQRRGSKRQPLLLIGELREELGTFRTRIASHISKTIFDERNGTALTTDIGLRVRVSRLGAKRRERASVSVLCTTCDLDNDLVASERFHPPEEIQEVCVKGENEGVFYNCKLHDPGSRPELLWVESVERYNVFGD